MFPSCPRCKTDEHLRYVDFQPGHPERYIANKPRGGGPVTRTRLVGAVVRYTCGRCGSAHGHTVPDDWTPPV